MTTIHYDIADDVAKVLSEGDPLRAILQYRGAYGSVSGALETLAGDSYREVDTRQSFRALVDAIPAPRTEAEPIAAELFRLARNCMMARYRHENL